MEKNQRFNKNKIISFLPDGDFYRKRAMQAMQREQFSDAEKYYKRALELNPGDALTHMEYGVFIMEVGRFEDAYELLKKADQIEPESEETTFYLAEVHAHLGLLREAKKYALKYIGLAPEGFFVEEAHEISEFADQEEMFLEESEDVDGEVLIMQEKARRMMEDGNFEEAIDVLEGLLLDYPKTWAVHNNLALAYFYIGKEKHAEDILYDVLREEKGNIHALCNLAVFFYYGRKEEKLQSMMELLSKIKPYQFEHRYKLGATFALTGRYEEAYHWLRSLQKRGFQGDVGYYFWLANAAYFTGHRKVAEQAYAMLLEMDPSKEGFEPWKTTENHVDMDSSEENVVFLIEKISSPHKSDRMLGLYLLGKSSHMQEILSHPGYIVMDELSAAEQLFLAHSLDYAFIGENAFEKAMEKALAICDLLYEQYQPLDEQGTQLFQMWFALCENALGQDYAFRNPKALAASADYMFQISRNTPVTKKALAEKYGISVATLTKYMQELIAYLPESTDE
ncbi:tetratricopeptide repeat protein [Sporosarcina sp. GW1-11]|uniref:tetratricopeptide repeat protein n=1 Tax=Sporosarcina sp. GW1-11 TaxID=2899126 RepID=UPI00294BD807|nr:tetratricopeptide repeat protein [Sporosarcina sp. GW1-11]MDV6378409.1 tetratricopeptide repeat protein [Sporosarcina sp. GW1-11]